MLFNKKDLIVSLKHLSKVSKESYFSSSSQFLIIQSTDKESVLSFHVPVRTNSETFSPFLVGTKQLLKIIKNEKNTKQVKLVLDRDNLLINSNKLKIKPSESLETPFTKKEYGQTYLAKDVFNALDFASKAVAIDKDRPESTRYLLFNKQDLVGTDGYRLNLAKLPIPLPCSKSFLMSTERIRILLNLLESSKDSNDSVSFDFCESLAKTFLRIQQQNSKKSTPKLFCKTSCDEMFWTLDSRDTSCDAYTFPPYEALIKNTEDAVILRSYVNGNSLKQILKTFSEQNSVFLKNKINHFIVSGKEDGTGEKIEITTSNHPAWNYPADAKSLPVAEEFNPKYLLESIPDTKRSIRVNLSEYSLIISSKDNNYYSIIMCMR